MSRRTIFNTVEIDKLEGLNPVIKQFLLAMQDDLVALNTIQQDSTVTVFPDVPEFGGIFTTTKGAYEAIWTNDPTPLPKWRRLSDSTLYDAGDTIPTTL
jgi:hypothetical protein